MACEPSEAVAAIPTIHLDGLSIRDHHAATVQAIHTACLTKGFFYIDGHGVDGSAVLTQTRLLFALPEEEKRALSDRTMSRGYTAFREETLDPTNQPTVGDTKEGFYISINDICEDDPRYNPAKLAGPNQWPNASKSPSLVDPATFQTTMLVYMKAVQEVAITVVRLIAESLDLDAHYFDHAVVDHNPMASLRLLHYEAVVSDITKGVYGCGAHTDYGLITILLTDGENDGLQIFDTHGCNDWINVPTVPGCLIVNLGDMLERWTNGCYRSTLHRVVNQTGRERYSVPFFFEPAFDTVVKCLPVCCSPNNPPRYAPTTSGEHLLAKYRATHADFVSPVTDVANNESNDDAG